ncbi:MAG: MotA/TolQ/ExbB proton channel family protein, partial [Candidatus Thermochlorobacter sp.]
MKQGTFTIVLILVAFAVGLGIYFWFGSQPKESIFHAIYEGGPLVSVLIAFIIMIFAYVIERSIALGKAKGKGSMSDFIRDIKTEIEAGR